MKKLTPLVAILAFLFTACSSTTSIPSQIPETMKEACSLYQTVRPEVVRLRAYARDNWTAIPPSAQETLRKLDGHLPALDRAGMAVCGIAGSVDLGTGVVRGASGGVQWDNVLAAVVKAAALAADLKSKGVI